MRQITFSALPRLFECPASHVLPWEEEDEEPAEFRDRGRAAHTYLEHFREFGPDAIKKVAEEHRDFCEMIDVASLPTDLSTEVALAYNPVLRTARVLKSKFHRDYSDAHDPEICGTLDVLGLSESMAYVSDYKTGWAKQPKAKEHPQLLMGALCAWRAFDKPSALLEVIEVREGKNWRDSAEVDTFDLLAFEERVLDLWSAIDKLDHQCDLVPLDTHPGPHCRYCPAFKACPAQTNLATIATDGTLAAEVEKWTGVLTATGAREAYSKYRAMKMLTQRAGDIIKAYASKNPIELGEGKMYGLVKTAGVERLDGDVTFTQCVRLFGHDVANAMMTRTVTKKAMAAALRAHKETLGTTQVKALEALLQAVRAADGASRKPGATMKEFDVKGDER